jgi:hypothetical protein
VLLPAHELLTIYPGFVSVYDSHHLQFDETWRDTCLLLGAATLKGALSPVDVLQKLKGMLKAIDAHPKVVDRNSLHPDMCWTVSSGPARQGP